MNACATLTASLISLEQISLKPGNKLIDLVLTSEKRFLPLACRVDRIETNETVVEDQAENTCETLTNLETIDQKTG